MGQVRAGMRLLVGVDPEVVDILEDKYISAAALRVFRKAKPGRQVDMAQLMVSASNFTKAYADALLVGTDMLL